MGLQYCRQGGYICCIALCVCKEVVAMGVLYCVVRLDRDNGSVVG